MTPVHEALLREIGRALGWTGAYEERPDPLDEVRRGYSGALTPENGSLTVLGGAVEPGPRARVAWIEKRVGIPVRGYIPGVLELKIATGGTLQTIYLDQYNPMFGFDLSFIGWADEFVVTIYRDKDGHFIWVVPPHAPDAQRYLRITSTHATDGRFVYFTKAWFTPDTIEVVALPSLTTLAPMCCSGVNRGLSLRWGDDKLKVVEEWSVSRDDSDDVTSKERVVSTLNPPALHQQRALTPAFREQLRQALFGSATTNEHGWFIDLACARFWGPPHPVDSVYPHYDGDEDGLYYFPKRYRQLRQSDRAAADRILATLNQVAALGSKDEPETGWDHSLDFEAGALAMAVRHAVRFAHALRALCRRPLKKFPLWLDR